MSYVAFVQTYWWPFGAALLGICRFLLQSLQIALFAFGGHGLQFNRGEEFLPCPESMHELMNGEESKQVCLNLMVTLHLVFD